MTGAEQRRAHRAALMAMTDRLVAAHGGTAPAGRVLATVAVCRSELHRAGVQGAELISSTEAMVRARLASPLLGRRDNSLHLAGHGQALVGQSVPSR